MNTLSKNALTIVSSGLVAVAIVNILAWSLSIDDLGYVIMWSAFIAAAISNALTRKFWKP